MNPINEFAGAYSFLSNFYKVNVKYCGLVYPSVENAYQAMKVGPEGSAAFSLFPPIDETSLFKKPFPVMAAYKAKQAGKRIKPLRPDWEQVKLSIMLDLLRLKFQYNPWKQKLIDTYPAELIEGNYWHDTFWGVCGGVGENHLGKLLMQVREELRGGRTTP